MYEPKHRKCEHDPEPFVTKWYKLGVVSDRWLEFAPRSRYCQKREHYRSLRHYRKFR